jgi:peptide chain release factor 1
MEEKVKKLLTKLQEVEVKLGDPDTFLDNKLYKQLSQEHSYLIKLKDAHDYFRKVSEQLIENKALLISEEDPELIQVIKEEIDDLEKQVVLSRAALEAILVPPDPRDSRNIILEIRAGTGGDEAGLFVGDLVRMYKLYADRKGWQLEVLSASESEAGGFREYVMGISGVDVFRFLQYEGGTHRVQRVPKTETQGRVHTSAVTVAALLEPTEEDDIEVDEKDLKIDTYRASGAGGQHVNVTDSAVRITHLPTKTVVACQDERSQHKNKAKAMRVLKARIAETLMREKHKELSETRSSQVGSGDRSEKIRTYNFPQNRMTDHRINLTLYKLDQVLQGDLDEMTIALVSFFHQKKLSS